MSRLLCCLCERRADMGAALSHPQEGEACDGAVVTAAPPTMADVIRERKKKAAGSGLGTLRRRIALVRRPRDNRPDRGCEHARFIRSVVSSWRLVEVFLLCEELEAGAALRDLVTQAELAREPAGALHADLAQAYKDRWWCDVELVGSGWSLAAHRAILCARCSYFRDLLQRYPPSCCRVPLEGAGASLSRDELEACVLALYAGTSVCSRGTLCALCAKWDRGVNADGDLDIINVDNNGTCRSSSVCGCGRSRVDAATLRRLGALLGFSLDSLHHDMRYLLDSACRSSSVCGCGRSRVDAATLRRLGALLGFSLDSLHHDMRYLLDSGEMADARLVFRLEGGCGLAYGFRTALELPCHRLVLAARSRFFRSVMSRRSAGGGGPGAAPAGAWCVDEKVLPRRFARALLHAAYTDIVDLSLIGRNSTSPSSTNSTGSGTNAWAGVTRSGTRPVTAAMLDDAFQLYEIARFLEMPIVVQGCEDAIVEALCPDSLPHVLRWAAQAHASQWVQRQAMRYLRDEFPTIMSSNSCGRIPSHALSEALASPFLQASEPQALRALLRWAACAMPQRESNIVWSRAQSVGRRGGRRRDAGDAALRDALAPLAPLLRLEHLPPDHDLLQQVVRRGIVAGAAGERAGAADAWLGRGSYRPPRCFLPYLDEIKALLEEQAVPEAELARARRERYLQRIPDTLYMVAAGRVGARSPRSSSPTSSLAGAARACVSPRVLAGLRARARHLRAAPPARRAAALHDNDTLTVYKQRACVSPRVLAGLRARARHLRAAPPARRAAALHDNDTLTVYKQVCVARVRVAARAGGAACARTPPARRAACAPSCRAARQRYAHRVQAGMCSARACRRACWRGCVRAHATCAPRRLRAELPRCTTTIRSPCTSRSPCAPSARCRCRTRAPSCSSPSWTATENETRNSGSAERTGRRTVCACGAWTSSPGTSAAGLWAAAAARCAARPRVVCARTTPLLGTTRGRARVGEKAARGRPTRRNTDNRCRRARRACRARRAAPAPAPRGCRPPCPTWPWHPMPTLTSSPPGITSGTRRTESTAAAACCSWTWATAPRTRPDQGRARSGREARGRSGNTRQPCRACAAAPTTTSCAPPSSSPSSERTRRLAPRWARPPWARRPCCWGRPRRLPRRRAPPRRCRKTGRTMRCTPLTARAAARARRRSAPSAARPRRNTCQLGAWGTRGARAGPPAARARAPRARRRPARRPRRPRTSASTASRRPPTRTTDWRRRTRARARAADTRTREARPRRSRTTTPATTASDCARRLRHSGATVAHGLCSLTAVHAGATVLSLHLKTGTCMCCVTEEFERPVRE